MIGMRRSAMASQAEISTEMKLTSRKRLRLRRRSTVRRRRESLELLGTQVSPHRLRGTSTTSRIYRIDPGVGPACTAKPRVGRA